MQGFDLSNISDLYVGSTQYSAIYFGSQLIWSVDYSEKYLTFELLEPSAFTIIANTDLTNVSILYSTDNGNTWSNVLSHYGVTPTFPAGTKILWKGNLSIVDTTNAGPITFSNSYSYVSTRGNFNVSGNPSSLYFGDNFRTIHTLYDNMYNNLFLNNDKLINAENIALTAINLYGADYCYGGMFEGCTSLVSAPELPAMTLSEYCYNRMFYGCSSLVEAPELPASIMAYHCYERMFTNCTSLNYIKCLATEVNGSYYTFGWTLNVAATGTFVKDELATWGTGGFSAIPSGWTTQTVPHDYSKDYLTIESIDSNGSSVHFTNLLSTAVDFEYSTDYYNWTSVHFYPSEILNDISLSEGGKLYLRATNEAYSNENSPGFVIEVSGDANVYGNIMSIINKDTYETLTTISPHAFSYLFVGDIVSAEHLILPATTLADYCYRNMFSSCHSLTTAPVVLPATTLADSCYYGMFNDCYSLTTAPALPATTLAEYCYYKMFYGCTSLTTAPALPATTLAAECYENMFKNCTSLTTAPALPATTLAGYCYISMFEGCTSLTTAPALPATTLILSCYYNMFKNCTSLTSAPTLSATTLANGCYGHMFENCTSLTTAPELPATTLTSNCYDSMFKGCTSLTTAPELPATIAWSQCYDNMFNGCSSLNYIKCLLIRLSAYRATNAWVDGVSSTGTFTKAASMTDWTTGTSGIPSGWTVQDAS